MKQDAVIDCGERLGKLQLSQFSAATQKHGLGICTNAVPIEAGNFKQNVSLTTDKGRWIFRGRSHYSWQFPKERFFAELLGRKTSAPVPLPYIVDESLEPFAFDYALMPEMPGMQLSDRERFAALSSSDQNAIAFLQGQFLRDLQTYKHATFGYYDEEVGDIIGYEQAYSKEVILRARTCVQRANDVTKTLSLEEVEMLFDKNDHLPKIDDALPVFVMEDYKDDNMCVAKKGNEWKVTGLFDLMGAKFGHPLEDLPRQYAVYLDIQRPECAAAFLAGYGVTKEDVALFNLFMLIDRLIIWEFGIREGKDWFEGKSFLAWSEPHRLADSPFFTRR